MQVFDGFGCGWNYTIGPVLVYTGPESIDRINTSPMPVVVVAERMSPEEVGRIDATHVYGFVVEQCPPADPLAVYFGNQHRATVLRAEGCYDAVHDGQTVIVDGVEGKVILDPDPETRSHYEALRAQGPPPKPEGFADELLKDTMDMRGLDPAELKKGFIDFAALEKAMGTFLKMATGSVLTKSEIEQVQSMVAGSPFEESTAEKLERYNEIAREREAEEKAAAKAQKANARGARSAGGRESAQERRRRRQERRRR